MLPKAIRAQIYYTQEIRIKLINFLRGKSNSGHYPQRLTSGQLAGEITQKGADFYIYSLEAVIFKGMDCTENFVRPSEPQRVNGGLCKMSLL